MGYIEIRKNVKILTIVSICAIALSVYAVSMIDDARILIKSQKEEIYLLKSEAYIQAIIKTKVMPSCMKQTPKKTRKH